MIKSIIIKSPDSVFTKQKKTSWKVEAIRWKPVRTLTVYGRASRWEQLEPSAICSGMLHHILPPAIRSNTRQMLDYWSLFLPCLAPNTSFILPVT